MKGSEFIKKVKALGKRKKVVVRLDAKRGKGSHMTLYYGERVTIMRNLKDEIKTGTFTPCWISLALTSAICMNRQTR